MTSSKAGKAGSKNDRWQPRQKAGQKWTVLQYFLKQHILVRETPQILILPTDD
jgi:hypothetical protein